MRVFKMKENASHNSLCTTFGGAARGLGPHGVWGRTGSGADRPCNQPFNPERDRRNASTVFSSRVYGNPA